ncbi:hypothetical protein WA026_021594 [Henosepilachna vigintioctopunctata]|uniref:Uncharacterized protein n=1 Tax=Henosepilachna vigintioctopunctata TaxID=420089 RepID=A0AAW1UW04_9CUCU
MYSLKFIIVLIAVVVILEAKEEKNQNREILKKCAEANGMDMTKMKEMWKKNVSEKKNGKSGESTEGISKQFLCAHKCMWEEKGFLSKTTIDIEKVKRSELLKKFIKKENVDAYLKCLKPIEIKNCEDFAEVLECHIKAISSKS